MIKRFAVTLCLLTSTIWVATAVPAVFAQQATPTVTQEQTILNPTLTLQDLPRGFRELPKNMEELVKPRLEAFTQKLTQTGMKPGKYFIFVNPRTRQVLFGFTGVFPTQPEQADFDAILKQMQEPEVQQEIINRYRDAFKQERIEIVDYSPLPDLNNIAEASTGMSVSIAMQGQPLRLDITAFRRSNIGAFAAIINSNRQVSSQAGSQEQVLKLDTIARKLDSRILESSGTATPVVAPNLEVTPNQSANPPANLTPADDAGSDSTGVGDSSVNSPDSMEIK